MIGILSDAHGNYQAFDKAISLLSGLGAKQFVFLGDALGYFPNSMVLDSIVSMGSKTYCILGNHEDIILSGVLKNELETVYQHKAIYHILTEQHFKMIKRWPASLKIKFVIGDALFVHGSPRNETYEYIYPDTDLKKYRVKERYVFMGHTHHAFLKQYKNTVYVNVGSCGLPRDHGTLGSAVLFDEQAGFVRILRFDIRKQLDQLLATLPNVSPSILKLTQREPETYTGELVG